MSFSITNNMMKVAAISQITVGWYFPKSV